MTTKNFTSLLFPKHCPPPSWRLGCLWRYTTLETQIFTSSNKKEILIRLTWLFPVYFFFLYPHLQIFKFSGSGLVTDYISCSLTKSSLQYLVNEILNCWAILLWIIPLSYCLQIVLCHLNAWGNFHWLYSFSGL